MDSSWNIIILNFEFLLILNHDDGTLNYLKKEDMGKHEGLLDTQRGGSKNSRRYFVVENHRFYFAILISFPHNMEFCCNSFYFSIKLRSINLCNNFHGHIIL
jgi:hypothetical protein